MLSLDECGEKYGYTPLVPVNELHDEYFKVRLQKFFARVEKAQTRCAGGKMVFQDALAEEFQHDLDDFIITRFRNLGVECVRRKFQNISWPGFLLNGMGVWYRKRGLNTLAEKCYSDVIEQMETSTVHIRSYPKMVFFMNVAILSMRFGKTEKALSYCNQALHVREQNSSELENDPGYTDHTLGNIHKELVDIYDELGDSAESERHRTIAFELFNKLPYTQVSDDFYCQYWRHLALTRNTAEAIMRYKSFAKSTKKRYGKDSRRYGEVLKDIGKVYYERQEYEQAKVYAEKAITIYEKIKEQLNIYDFAMVKYYLAHIYAELNINFTKTLKLFEEALDGVKQSLGPDDSSIPIIQSQIDRVKYFTQEGFDCPDCVFSLAGVKKKYLHAMTRTQLLEYASKNSTGLGKTEDLMKSELVDLVFERVVLREGDAEKKVPECAVHLSKNLRRARECETCNMKSQNLKKCSSCESVFYCSKECQKKDWKNHKKECKKKRKKAAA